VVFWGCKYTSIFLNWKNFSELKNDFFRAAS